MLKQEKFFESCECGYIEGVKDLINDPDVDPSVGGNWAIRWTAYCGYTEIIKLLLNDPRVDPSDKNNQAIRWAAEEGHLEIVQLFKKYYQEHGLTIPNCVL